MSFTIAKHSIRKVGVLYNKTIQNTHSAYLLPLYTPLA